MTNKKKDEKLVEMELFIVSKVGKIESVMHFKLDEFEYGCERNELFKIRHNISWIPNTSRVLEHSYDKRLKKTHKIIESIIERNNLK